MGDRGDRDERRPAEEGAADADADHPAGWIPAGDPPLDAVHDGSAPDPADDLDALVRTAFDLLPTQVAVLDADGRIVHTNRTWSAFGEANDIDGPADTVGVNYLAVCDGADDEHAGRAAAGIRSVLDGASDPFSMEYPCHGPDEPRWFVMWARGFERDGDRYAVVVHLDVTERRLSERAVARRNAELEAVERIGELVREIVASLGQATTRAEVERTVCRGLTAGGTYAAAAVVDPTTADGRLRVTERARREGRSGFGVDETIADDRIAALADDALRDGETRVDREASSPTTSTDGPGAVAAVPLRHREAVYGVLLVRSDDPAAFDEREAAALDVLGESAGFAVHAVETERFLHADDTLELRFRLREDALPFFSAVAAESDCTVEFGDVIPGREGVLVVYVTVHDAGGDAVASLATGHDAVESVRVLEDGDGGAPARLELRYRPPSPVHDLVAAGGAVRTCRVAADGGLLVAEVDDAATMRAVVESLADAAVLVGKRGRSRGERRPGEAAPLDLDLTDRQRDALLAAHRGGYYEWPSRASTAEELADAMDVTPQTFHEHLRRAEGKVVDRAVEAGLARRAPDPE